MTQNLPLLRNLPLPVRLIAAGVLVTLGMGYAYALANVALSVGLAPKEIAAKYHGTAAPAASAAKTQGEQGLDLDNDAALAQAPAPQPAPSLKHLLGEGHFHLLGMTSFFLWLSILGLLTALPEKVKLAAVSLPYPAIVIDHLGMLGTRFISPRFSILIMLAGAVMGACFVALWFGAAWELLPNARQKKVKIRAAATAALT